MIDISEKPPMFLLIDLFCGCGGTTLGFENARIGDYKPYKIIAAVNHDPVAIHSHWANHPDVEHYEEDIRTLNLTRLLNTLNFWRKKYPKAKVILWASPDCTHHSGAKGGQPREADSRTLAAHLYRYIRILDPDYIMIENVREFKGWGPLDENKRPVKHLKGIHFERWRNFIKSHFGYTDEWRMQCAADFGARTSRTRLFGIFSRKVGEGFRLPYAWPESTHSKYPKKTGLKPWLPVRDILKLDDHGYSVLNRSRNPDMPKGRKQDIRDTTLERIYAGLIKHVQPKINQFMMMNYGGSPEHKNFSLEEPGHTVTTSDHHTLVSSEFLVKLNSRNQKTGKVSSPSLEEPAPTVACQRQPNMASAHFIATYNKGSVIRDIEDSAATVCTKDRMKLVEAQWMDLYYGSGQKEKSIEEPGSAVLTNPKLNLASAFYLDKQYGSEFNHQSVENPAGTVTVNPKLSLVESQFLMPTNFNNKPVSLDSPAPVVTADRHHHYIVDCQFNNKGRSIDKPAQTLIAMMGKKPPYLITTESGQFAIEVYPDDSYMTKVIKRFMADNGIVDIKMRMLYVEELLQIQGFPKDYKLQGSDEQKKKWIGNSVEATFAKAWAEAMANKLYSKPKTNAKKPISQFQRRSIIRSDV
jgi:DNA (cytosine-5)-methyltransferase 1